jgi:hypothetical protein
MANIAEYRFREYGDRKIAEDRMYYDCGGYVYSETSGASEYPYGLYISDSCTNASKAAQICEANGGKRF